MQKKTKIFWGVTLLSTIAIGIWGYSVLSRKHKSAKNLKPDFTMSASDLYSQYLASETEGDKKFLNKIIIVKGKISEVINHGSAKFYLLDKRVAGGVNCEMSNDFEKETSPIPSDSVLTIKGKCTGFLVDVNLVDCVMQ